MNTSKRILLERGNYREPGGKKIYLGGIISWIKILDMRLTSIGNFRSRIDCLTGIVLLQTSELSCGRRGIEDDFDKDDVFKIVDEPLAPRRIICCQMKLRIRRTRVHLISHFRLHPHFFLHSNPFLSKLILNWERYISFIVLFLVCSN